MVEGKELLDDDCECQELPTERIRCRAGATTFWETELGEKDFDNAGSLCHGWSALPIYYYHLFKVGKAK